MSSYGSKDRCCVSPAVNENYDYMKGITKDPKSNATKAIFKPMSSAYENESSARQARVEQDSAIANPDPK